MKEIKKTGDKKEREFVRHGSAKEEKKPKKYVRSESGDIWICDVDVVHDGDLEAKGCKRAPVEIADKLPYA